MRESEFRRKLDKVGQFARHHFFTPDQIVELAREAGATFEPERMGYLPPLDWHSTLEEGVVIFGNAPCMNGQQAREAIRRCEAAEQAANLIRASSLDYPIDRQAVLAVLEGTK